MKFKNNPARIGPVDDARRERLLQIDEVVRSSSTKRTKLRWPSAQEIQRAALNDLPVDGPATKVLSLGAQLGDFSRIIGNGATVITHDRHESLVVPVADRSLQASWSGTSNDLDNVPLSVADAEPRRVSCFITISNQLRVSNPVLAGQFVEMQLLSAVGAALDDAMINGSGTSGEPLGILGDSDVLRHVRAVAGVTTLQDLAGMEQTISEAHGEDDPESFVWLSSPDVRANLRTTAGVSGVGELFGTPIWSGKPDRSAGGPLGFQATVLPTAPNGTMILVQAPQIGVFDWGEMQIETLTDSSQAKQGFSTLLVSAYIDCGVLNPNGVCVAVDPA